MIASITRQCRVIMDRLTVQIIRSKTGIGVVVGNANNPVRLNKDSAVTQRAPIVNIHQILFSVCM